MKENNLSIYLRKENFDIYKELADTMNIPLSSLIAQQLQDATNIETIKKLTLIAKQAKETLANGKQRR